MRGIERGELRGDVHLELMIDMLAGPNVYRALVMHESLRDVYARAPALFDALHESPMRRILAAAAVAAGATPVIEPSCCAPSPSPAIDAAACSARSTPLPGE